MADHAEVPGKGEHWIRKGRTGLEALVAIHEAKGHEVSFHPAGGGFGRSMPMDDFTAAFERVTPATIADWASAYRKVDIVGDWFPDDAAPIPAYTNGKVWNGWATPGFTREAVEAAVADGRLCSPEAGTAIVHDPVRDSYVLLSTTGGEPLPEGIDYAAALSGAASGAMEMAVGGVELQIDDYPGRTVRAGDELVRLYDIGSHSWCWQEAPEPSPASVPGR